MAELTMTGQVWLHLVSCALNGKKPDAQRLRGISLQALYALAKQHSMTALTAFALEAAGVSEPHFHEAKTKAIRKLALFDIERTKLFRAFDAAKIAYCPLKGIILKNFYPSFGMREMSDNDILCDPSRMDDVRSIMKQHGFLCTSVDTYGHDTYEKPPCLEFEMHLTLFTKDFMPAFAAYYAGIFERLQQADGCEYRFSDEDFYLYLLAHEYKHFSHFGTGVRPLADIYLFLKKHPALDWKYVNAELQKLGLSAFEEHSRTLACKVMAEQPLTDEETEQLLSFYLNSALYGTAVQGEQNQLTRQLDGKDTAGAKAGYILRRIFLSGDALKRNYPFFYRHKVLLPALYIYRPIRGIFHHPKSLIHDTKSLAKYKSPKYRF